MDTAVPLGRTLQRRFPTVTVPTARTPFANVPLAVITSPIWSGSPACEKIYATKDGEDIHALEEVDLAIRDGEFISVVGPSGCGKTTLLKILAGILDRTAGEVTIAGRNSERAEPRTGRRVPGPGTAAVANGAAERDGAGRGAEARPRHIRGARPRSCWPWSDSPASRASIPANCPAACSSASASAGRWSTIPRSY